MTPYTHLLWTPAILYSLLLSELSVSPESPTATHPSNHHLQPPAQSVGGRGGKRSLAGKKELGFSESILLTIPHLFLILWCEVKSLSRVQLYVTPWTVAYQAPLSMGFSRQECWSGLPFPSPGDLPDPGIEPRSPTLQVDALPSEPPGKPVNSHPINSFKSGDKFIILDMKGQNVEDTGPEKGGLWEV